MSHRIHDNSIQLSVGKRGNKEGGDEFGEGGEKTANKAGG